MSAVETAVFCPYKGLQPFTEEDSKYFFGRNRDREIIGANLYSAPLTVLHGASGVGKSSVLMAGVVPQLRKTPRLAVIIFRNWQSGDFASAIKLETLGAVCTALSQQRDDLRRTIDERLIQESAALRQVEERLAVETVSHATDERAAQNKRMLLDALRLFKQYLDDKEHLDLRSVTFDELLLKCKLVSGSTLLFIFDQFEEYFLYNSPANGKAGFDAELARAINRQDIDANFLLSLREDGLSKLDRFKGRIPNLLSNMLRLDHLDRRSAEEAIRKPLDKYNSEPPGNAAPVKIEDALVNTLLNEVQTGKVTLDQTGQGQTTAQSGDSSSTAKIETPFLQMVLMRLWDQETANGSHKLQLKTLNELGGAESIVRTHLDSVMAKLGESGHDYPDTAARLFRFLVTPSGMKIAHTLGDLATLAELPEDDVKPVLDALIEVRILRPVDPPLGQSGTRYEIFHDVLAPAILDWRARYVKDQKLIEAERHAEEERQRAEKESRSAARFRLLAMALGVVTVVAVVLAGLAWSKHSEALASERKAVEEHQKAEVALSEAKKANLEAMKANHEAVLAQQAATTERIAKEKQAQLAETRTKEAERAKTDAIAAQREAEAAGQHAKEQARLATQRKIEADKATQNFQAEQLYGEAKSLSESLLGAIDKIEQDRKKYNEALKLFRQSDNLQGQAKTLFALANGYSTIALPIGADPREYGKDSKTIEKLNKAIELLEEARRLYQRPEMPDGFSEAEANTLTALGNLYRRIENHKEAIRSYEQALPLNRKTLNRRGEREVLVSLGELYSETDKSNAIRYYKQLISLYEQGEEAGWLSRLFATYMTIGKFYHQLEQTVEARNSYKEALKNAQLSGDTEGKINALIHLGEVNRELNDRQEALKYYYDAWVAISAYVTHDYDGNKELRLPDQLDYVDIAMGKLYSEMNEHQKALNQYKGLLNYYEGRLRDYPDYLPGGSYFASFQIADMFMDASKIYSALGEKQKAEDSYRKASQIYQGLENASSEELKKVAEEYEKFGNMRKAAEFYQKAKAAPPKNK